MGVGTDRNAAIQENKEEDESVKPWPFDKFDHEAPKTISVGKAT